MATVSVLVPFGGDCPHREAALEWVLSRLPDAWEVVVGRCDGPWVKAAAVADALSRATGELLVVHDADVACAELHAFAATVTTWGMPHGTVYRLTQAATQDVLNGATPSTAMPMDRTPYAGWWGGGIVVIQRDIYERVPLDARFIGWGNEDESWARALQVLAPEGVRGDADLFHLWHPPEPRITPRYGNPDGERLSRRYAAAVYKPADMEALIEEARACLSKASS